MLSCKLGNKYSHCLKEKESCALSQTNLHLRVPGKLSNVWPAGILILLAVNKRAGFELTAHQWCAVTANSWVTIHTLWFRETVHAGDWDNNKKEKLKKNNTWRQKTVHSSGKGLNDKYESFLDSELIMTVFCLKGIEFLSDYLQMKVCSHKTQMGFMLKNWGFMKSITSVKKHAGVYIQTQGRSCVSGWHWMRWNGLTKR